MKIAIVVSGYVKPGEVFVIDPEAAGALADAVRLQVDEEGAKIVVVATDDLKARLGGFAKLIGVEVVE